MPDDAALCKQIDTSARLVRPMHRPPPQEAASSSEATPGGGAGKDGDKVSVCRDFLRNVSTRGSKCRFSHVKKDAPSSNEGGANSSATENKKDVFVMQDTLR